MPSKEWLTIKQAADRLGFGVTKMRELADDPRSMFDVIIINEHGYRRISAASLDAYLAASRIRDKDEREQALEALRRRYRHEDDEPTDPVAKAKKRLSAAGMSEEDIAALGLDRL